MLEIWEVFGISITEYWLGNHALERMILLSLTLWPRICGYRSVKEYKCVSNLLVVFVE